MELVSYNPHTITFGYVRAKLTWQDSGTISMSLVTQVGGGMQWWLGSV